MAKRLEEFARRTRRREGVLTKKQILFLHVLSKAKGPLDKETLCERAKAHPTSVTANALGSANARTRERREAKTGYPSLLSLGYVRSRQLDIEGKMETVYEITPEGLDALDRSFNV